MQLPLTEPPFPALSVGVIAGRLMLTKSTMSVVGKIVYSGKLAVNFPVKVTNIGLSKL